MTEEGMEGLSQCLRALNPLENLKLYFLMSIFQKHIHFLFNYRCVGITGWGLVSLGFGLDELEFLKNLDLKLWLNA